MGNWRIVVEGTGAHHNKDYPQDANRMFHEFVRDLYRVGNKVLVASFEVLGQIEYNQDDLNRLYAEINDWREKYQKENDSSPLIDQKEIEIISQHRCQYRNALDYIANKEF